MLDVVLAAAVATGVGTEAGGAIAYPASFFADLRPNNAYEMLPRLPGFTFSSGAAVRGFAGAAGNVLIDGERPSSKSVTLDEVLKRIPAAAVDRIELIRGGAPGIDMQGWPLVANVIRRRDALSTTAATLGSRTVANSGWTTPEADLELTRRLGRLRLDAALHAMGQVNFETGDGRLDQFGPGGALIQGGPLHARRPGQFIGGSGSAELARGADTWRLNLAADDQQERTRESDEIDDPAGRRLGMQFITAKLRIRRYEAGGDYAHRFNGWLAGRLVGLSTYKRQVNLSGQASPAGNDTSSDRSTATETILRGTLTAEPSAVLTLESGGEGALNVLDVADTYTHNGVAVVLPNAKVRVEERRAEGFATAFWKPAPRLSLEAGVRVEVSRIGETGDTRLSRSFLFGKPRAVLTWTPAKDSQVRLRLEREVGQLDFRSFAASATLGGGEVNAGNAHLEPERSWTLETALERRFWGKGAAIATLSVSQVQHVLDYLPIDGRFDALGNIGNGRRETMKLDLTLPLQRLGVPGGLVSTEGAWQWSQVADPLTGRSRAVSQEIRFTGFVRFSQDLPALRSTWGINGNIGYPQTQYRIGEVRRQSWGTFWFLYWDWKPEPKLTFHAEVQNVMSRVSRRYRTFYAVPRSAGVVTGYELRSAQLKPIVFLKLRKVL